MVYDLNHITVLIADDMKPMLDLTRSVLETFIVQKTVKKALI